MGRLSPLLLPRTSAPTVYRQSLTYKGHGINCDNYLRLVRVFTRPHHEIENDPRVWGQVGFLIDSELEGETSAAQSSWVSGHCSRNEGVLISAQVSAVALPIKEGDSDTVWIVETCPFGSLPDG
jgi:hypothetical protein